MCATALAAAGATTASAAPANGIFNTYGITDVDNRANSEIYGSSVRYSLAAELMPEGGTVGLPGADTHDSVPLRMPDTTGTLANLASMKGQTYDLLLRDRKPYTKVHFFGLATDGNNIGGTFTFKHSGDVVPQTNDIRFNDWANTTGLGAAKHIAIGPMPYRAQSNGGQNNVNFYVFHIPVALNTTDKDLVSVTFPADRVPSTGNGQAYVLALTFEDAEGNFTPAYLASPPERPDDVVAPTSSHTLRPAAPDGADGWYKTAPKVTITGFDDKGIDHVEYRIDKRGWKTYTGPLTIADGQHKVDYRAVDKGGNYEAFHTFDVKVDATAPVTTLRRAPALPLAAGWYDMPVGLALSAADGPGTGVARTEYRIGDGKWTEYEEPLELSEPGIYTFAYRSIDNAGNVEQTNETTLKVDRHAPVTTAKVNGAAPAESYQAPPTVTLAATDGAGSGVARTEYRIDDGDWQEYTAPFTVPGNGGHWVDYRSIDAAGNHENAKGFVFATTPPRGGGGDGGGNKPPGGDPGGKPGPDPKPWAAVVKPAATRTTVAALRTGKLSVGVRCLAVDRGTLQLTVSKAVARKLGLKSVTLAKAAVRCGADGRGTVTLKPGANVRRALAKKPKLSLRVTLTLQLKGDGGSARAKRTLTLRGAAR